jgi:glutamine amidotransferase
MIAIIDYNLGNIGSIQNMLKKIGVQFIVTNDPKEIKRANKLILPGVGSFDNGIRNLQNLNLISILNKEVIQNKKPILGICLGMQLMTQGSEEGKDKGLGWIPVNIVSFKNIEEYKGTIPLMGWNYVKVIKPNKLLNHNKSRFYFVHAFHCKRNAFEILTSEINGYDYCAAFQNNNIYGVQFHPEKSHLFGLELLTNFCNL